MSYLDGITDAMGMNLGKLQKTVRAGVTVCCSPWGYKESGTTGQLNDSSGKEMRFTRGSGGVGAQEGDHKAQTSR